MSRSYYAVFADLAYGDAIKRKRGKPQGVDYHAKLSTDETAIFQQRSTKKIIIASRGTTLKFKSALKDLTTDILVGFAGIGISDRARDLNKIVKKFVKQVGKKNVVVVGHSLGGSLAKNVARKFGVQAYIFNAGSSPLEQLGRKKSDSNIHDYRVKGDAVSMWAPKTKNTEIMEKTDKDKNAHTLDQFTEEPKKKKSKKRAKPEEPAAEGAEPPPKKKRGRPRKKAIV